jgi:hypothetical protein
VSECCVWGCAGRVLAHIALPLWPEHPGGLYLNYGTSPVPHFYAALRLIRLDAFSKPAMSSFSHDGSRLPRPCRRPIRARSHATSLSRLRPRRRSVCGLAHWLLLVARSRARCMACIPLSSPAHPQKPDGHPVVVAHARTVGRSPRRWTRWRGCELLLLVLVSKLVPHTVMQASDYSCA